MASDAYNHLAGSFLPTLKYHQGRKHALFVLQLISLFTFFGPVLFRMYTMPEHFPTQFTHIVLAIVILVLLAAIYAANLWSIIREHLLLTSIFFAIQLLYVFAQVLFFCSPSLNYFLASRFGFNYGTIKGKDFVSDSVELVLYGLFVYDLWVMRTAAKKSAETLQAPRLQELKQAEEAATEVVNRGN